MRVGRPLLESPPNTWVWLFNSCEQQDPVFSLCPSTDVTATSGGPLCPAASTHWGGMETLWPPSVPRVWLQKNKSQCPVRTDPFCTSLGLGSPLDLLQKIRGGYKQNPNLTQSGRCLWQKDPPTCSRYSEQSPFHRDS